MIQLKRLLMIHWQSYNFQVVDFSQVTLLTGQTGVGKSTIIDALNVVLLGEKQKHIFNKAANENSARTFESYLYGKFGDDGGEGFLYLRKDNFTSYVVAEFYNEEEAKYFCCGFVADCYKDLGTPNFQWFTLPSRLPTNYFIDEQTSTPYSVSELIYQNQGKEKEDWFQFWSTDKDYRKMIAGLFGQVRDDYRRLLKQSVSFTPVKDIKAFLTDFVSETQSLIPVEAMQRGIYHYKMLELESEEMQQKIQQLEILLKEIDRLNKSNQTKQRQITFIEKAKLDWFVYQEKNLKESIQKNKEQNDALEIELTQLNEKNQFLKKEKENIQREKEQLAVLQDQAYLQGKLKDERNQLDRIAKETTYAEATVRDLKNWVGQLDLNQRKFTHVPDQALIEDFAAVNEQINRIYDEISHEKQTLEREKLEVEEALRLSLENQKALSDGKKIVGSTFEKFKQDLLLYLQQIDSTASVDYVADLLEIKPGEEAWQEAIEAYLGNQRFYLVVEPRFYMKALKYYQKVQQKQEVANIGIIHIDKLKKEKFAVHSSSLSTKLVVQNPILQPYIDYLLGRVVACETLEKLDHYQTAITKESFLYKGFVTRKLAVKNLRLAIGCQALEKQRLEMMKLIKQQQAQIAQLENEIRQRQLLLKYEKKDKKTEQIVQEYVDQSKLKQQQSIVEQLIEQLNKLDKSGLIALERKIKELENALEAIHNRAGEITNAKEGLKQKIQVDEKDKLPKKIKEILEQEKKYQIQTIDFHEKKNFETEYNEARQAYPKDDYQAFIFNFENNLKRTENTIETSKTDIITFVSNYNQKFTESLPVRVEQAFVYREVYEKYCESDLPEFTVQIRDAKKKAMQEFRYDFLGKLKSNIENLKRQVAEINDALKKQKFGEDIYYFKIEPEKAYRKYYDMITDEMLMDDGDWNLMSAAFESKFQKEIEQLFHILSGEGLDSQQDKFKHIQLFSDYKTYLSFDMFVVRNGIHERLSKTYTSKSGGETQIPLYIALLAAFAQVYRVHHSRGNNTIRLIVMDEAFNKIDGEKIKQCIQMIRSLGLQAIFSTPPEKIGEIMEEADQALVVFRKGNQASVEEFSSFPELVGEPYEL